MISDWPRDCLPSAHVVRPASITDSNDQRANVVSYNAVGHVNIISVLSAHLSGIRPSACALLDGLEQRHEHVRVVVRAFVLDDGYNP